MQQEIEPLPRAELGISRLSGVFVTGDLQNPVFMLQAAQDHLLFDGEALRVETNGRKNLSAYGAKAVFDIRQFGLPLFVD